MNDKRQNEKLFQEFPLVSNDPFVHSKLLLAGDMSQQQGREGVFLCYSVTAIHPQKMDAMNAAVDEVLRKYTGLMETSQVEVHAKQIWNGSERRKSPFNKIRSKKKMMRFLGELAKAFARSRPYVVAAVQFLTQQDASRAFSSKELFKAQKKFLIFSALGRLNKNIKICEDKDIGHPEFLMDKGEGVGTDDFFWEVGIADIDSNSSKPSLYRRIDPSYSLTDSRSSRAIQLSDLAAYFVAKHMVLYSQVVTATADQA